jgi:hemolysin-activating ACP:hemolysin acyltransferase
VGQSGVMWRKTWLVLVDDVKLFYTAGVYQLNPILYYIWSYFSHELVFNFILNKFNKASTKIWICGNGMTQELLTA